MTSIRLLPLTAATAVAAALACASPALAEQRHATPSGSGTTCADIAPCTLQTAMDGADDGDEIIVHEGTHAVNAAGSVNDEDLHVRPAGGAARPQVNVTGAGCGLSMGGGSYVQKLKVRILAAGATGVCTKDDAQVSRMIMTGAVDDAIGVRANPGSSARVFANSIYLPGAGAEGIVARAPYGMEIHNVSIQAGGDAIQLTDGNGGPIRIANSWLRGGGNTGYAIDADCAPDGMQLTITHNALSGVNLPAGCTDTDGNATTNYGANGAEMTLDADGAFRPVAGSGLANSGINTATTPNVDFETDPRPMDGKIDIGSDEVRVAPGVLTTGASGLTPRSAKLASLVTGRGAGYAAAFELGRTEAYGTTIDADKTSPKDVSGPVLDLPMSSTVVTGLQPGATYHFRTRATNQFGQTTIGPDRTFTTPSLPPAPGGEAGNGDPGGTGPVGPSGGTTSTADMVAPVCKLRLKRARRSGRAILTGRCSEAGVLRITTKRGRVTKLVAKVRIKRAGRVKRTIKLRRKVRPGKRLTITVRDIAGNTAPKLSLKLRTAKRRG